MKVVIFATYFAPNLGGGVARYEREVLPRLITVLAAAGCEVSVLVLDDGDGVRSSEAVKVIRLPVKRNESFKRILYNQIYGSLHSIGADLVFSMEYWLPLLPVWSKKNVVVLHDAHAEFEWRARRKRPLTAKFSRSFYWHSVFTKAARAADRVITDSQFAAEELMQVFNIPREKITAIYCGADTEYLQPVRDPDALALVGKRYSLPDPYYLFVGPSSGAKNLRYILETYLGTEPTDPLALPVVVTSSRPSALPEADILGRLEASGRGHLFHFAGHVETGDLPAVYSGARALIFPSLHEGFGLPPIEAMACGVPVVASNRTSVPEVVGDAAILIDPEDPQSLRAALVRTADERVRQDLIGKGFERVKIFTWDNTVRQIAGELLS